MKIISVQARTLRSVGVGLVLAVIASGFVPATASAADDSVLVSELPAPELGKKVPGSLADPLAGDGVVDALETADIAPPSAIESEDFEIELGGPAAPSTAGRPADSGLTSELSSSEALGESGISVDLADPSAADTTQPVKVDVSLLSDEDVVDLEAEGIAFELALDEVADDDLANVELAVRIPIDLLENKFGADFGSRLKWSQSFGASDDGEPVESTVDDSADEVVVTPTVTSRSTTLSASASATSSSGAGNFGATPLHSSSTWDVSAQTGAFAWSYSMRVPPAAAGPAPDLSLGYDSQAVDGLTSSTNNQPSAVGEGWTSSVTGFIERNYVSCAQDDDDDTNGAESSGDQCWKRDNGTLSLAGHSGVLVRIGETNSYRLQNDDGTRIKKYTNDTTVCDNSTYNDECWIVTTTDGTKYYFGKTKLSGWATGNETTDSVWTVPVFGDDAGEPCHASTFATSYCKQGWRWNLDYVVDLHSNAQAIFYHAETNKYRRNNTTAVTYERGGQVDRILYGFRNQQAYATNAASGRVIFKYATNGRCASTTGCSAGSLSAAAVKPTTPSKYPDVPWDQFCDDTSCTGKKSPTFWTNGMLDSVTTSVLKSGAYATVDVWTLSHSFPDPGDGTSASMWLTQIDHRGKTAAAAEPATVFGGATLRNRVWEQDGLGPLNKYRLTTIRTSLGAQLTVNYSPADCDVQNSADILAHLKTNDSRCYPQWWSPDISIPQEPQLDLFHKYVVSSTRADPRTGGGGSQVLETEYVYTGTPEWRMNESPFVAKKHRTYSVYAGYNKVEVRVGRASEPDLQQVTAYRFFQGVDGKYDAPTNVSGGGFRDYLRWAGRTREIQTRNGVNGEITSTTTIDPWSSSATAEQWGLKSYRTNDAQTSTLEPTSVSGQTQITVKQTWYDERGLPRKIYSAFSSPTDSRHSCTSIWNTPSTDSSPTGGMPWRTQTFATSCNENDESDEPDIPEDVISDQRISYDGLAPGVAPTKGDTTKREELSSYVDGAPVFYTSYQATYDALGRPLVETDGAGQTTTTSYVPTASAATGSGALRQVRVENSKQWATVTTIDPSWGAITSEVDQNGLTTTASYDDLGRSIAVWYPGRAQADYSTFPSVAYAYNLSVTAASVVETTTAEAVSFVSTFSLSDGLGREVQTQAPAEGGGAVVEDTFYNSRGQISRANSSYPIASNAGTSLFVPASQSQIGASVRAIYDGAGRQTDLILESLGSERSRVQYEYVGADKVSVIPPSGGTRSTSITNPVGDLTRLIEFEDLDPNSTASGKTSSYKYDNEGKLIRMTDPSGAVWSWDFDFRGQEIASESPDSGSSTTEYDSAGNIRLTTDERGVSIFHTYDDLNRITAKYDGTSASTGKLLSSWSYDGLNNKGALTEQASYDGSAPGAPGAKYSQTIDEFDAAGRPTKQTLVTPSTTPVFGAKSRQTTVQYNEVGDIRQQTSPAEGGLAAEILQYSYNSLGRFESLASAGYTYGLATYSSIGELAQLDRFGPSPTVRMSSTFGYDIATGALRKITQAKKVGSAYDIFSDTAYVRDASGQVLSKKTEFGEDSDDQCFDYDSFQNLRDAWTPESGDCADERSAQSLGGPAPYWNTYTVSRSTGNRVGATLRDGNSETTQTYSYATVAKPHAVSSVTSTAGSTTSTDTYQYDSAGNTVARPGQALEYDAYGRVTSVTTAAGVQKFVYAPDGSLLIQSDPSGATLLLGDTEIRRTQGVDVATRTYSESGIPLAERTTKTGTSNGALTWLASDDQGTAGMAIDASTGNETRRFSDPFGVTRGTTAVWNTAHGFLNALTSAFTSLVHLSAREYDPKLGRFLSVDAILNPATPRQNNGYSYAHNNPVTMADPSGNIPLGSGDTGVRPARPGQEAAKTPPAAGNESSSKAPPAAKQEPVWYNPSTYTADIWQTIGAVASGIVIGVIVTVAIVAFAGCVAITVGVCAAVGVVAAVGGSAAGSFAIYQNSPGEKTEQGQNEALLVGGATGLIGGVGTAAVAKIAGAVATKAAATAGTGAAKAATNGWKVGQNILNKTASGKAPAWSTQRSRFWKNTAANPKQAKKWDAENLELMAKGRAPEKYTAKRDRMEPMELSHEPIPQRDGGTAVVPRWADDHARVDPLRRVG